jgi:hypothetical protein
VSRTWTKAWEFNLTLRLLRRDVKRIPSRRFFYLLQESLYRTLSEKARDELIQGILYFLLTRGWSGRIFRAFINAFAVR